MANYGRKKWQKKGQPSSESCKPVTPRVTLLGAIDNYGKAYVSISQANSNADTFKLFMMELIEILDQQDK